MNEFQGSDTQANLQTELLARKGIEYAIIMISMTRERIELLFNAEIQVILANNQFPTSTFSIHDENHETKVKYLCRRILDYDMKAMRWEDPEDLFVKKEKRSRDTQDIKPVQDQKSPRGEDGEQMQMMVIDLEQGDGDESWNESFKEFTENLNEPRKQQGARFSRMNNSQQGRITLNKTRKSP
ncbi:MAG: hypothetical protein EZS28_020951 [Streblomastix strix]|uniref:Uncharacterized protein n=1 Tax=Streblomastix strix TaxID=222440 RepID=A0A5J4VML8_9EUKA|nr:MAG: hypothetical protein EZS28_020951 [Streblomastix strix]